MKLFCGVSSLYVILYPLVVLLTEFFKHIADTCCCQALLNFENSEAFIINSTGFSVL